MRPPPERKAIQQDESSDFTCADCGAPDGFYYTDDRVPMAEGKRCHMCFVKSIGPLYKRQLVDHEVSRECFSPVAALY